MMTDEEIQDLFKLLGISTKEPQQELIIPRYIDKKPLDVKFQSGTTIKPVVPYGIL